MSSDIMIANFGNASEIEAFNPITGTHWSGTLRK